MLPPSQPRANPLFVNDPTLEPALAVATKRLRQQRPDELARQAGQTVYPR